MNIRPLHTLDEYRSVVALEKEIWGYGDLDDAVGIPVFVITVKRGGILLGAYDNDRLIGFVYSIAGLKNGKPMQWSHMLGVLPQYRASGLGRALKLDQRRVAIESGLDLMEWTYDPLVAINAHLNFRRLGVIVEDYVENAYGESSSMLHRGNPTDRFIAQWWMRSDRVEGLVGGGRKTGIRDQGSGIGDQGSGTRDQGSGSRDSDPGMAQVLAVRVRGEWPEPARVELGRDEPQLTVAIPSGFTEMLDQDPGLARAWRFATRAVFTHYLTRGYKVVDFSFGPGSREGRYLLDAGLKSAPGPDTCTQD